MVQVLEKMQLQVQPQVQSPVLQKAKTKTNKQK
jgi:hypothetical protein